MVSVETAPSGTGTAMPLPATAVTAGFNSATVVLEAPNQPTVGIGVLIQFILFLGITIFVLSVSIYVTLGLEAALVVFVLPTVIATNFFFRMAFRPRDQKRGCLVMFFSVPCTALAILITASFLVDFGRADGLEAALVVFVLPTVIATNFFFRMAFRPRDQKRGCLVMFFSVPCTALAILITASFLVDFGRADAGTGPLSVILHVPFAFVSVIAAISGSTIAWRGQWKIRWQVILVVQQLYYDR